MHLFACRKSNIFSIKQILWNFFSGCSEKLPYFCLNKSFYHNRNIRTMKNCFFIIKTKNIPNLLLMTALGFLVITIFSTSCSKFNDDLDFDKLVVPGWNPEFALPLVNSSYTVSEFFNEANREFIKVDADGLVSMVYSSKELFSAYAGDFITLKDQDFDFSVPLIISQTGEIDTISNVYEFIFLRETEDQRLDSIFLKAGILKFTGVTDLNKDVSALLIELPELVNNQTGEPLTFNIPLNNPGGQLAEVTFDREVEMADYTLVFNAEGTGVNNQVNMKTNLVVYPDQNPVHPAYDLTIVGEMFGMEFHKLFGYLGSHSFDFVDSLRIAIFEQSLGGGVETGPDALKFNIQTKNSIGVPVTINGESLFVYSPVNSPFYEDIYLFGPGIENTFEIFSPSDQEIGQSIVSNIDFSQTNFPDVFLSLAPRKFFYDFKATLNPLGDTTQQNFVLDTSRIAFGTSLEFKLFTAIDLLTIQDTVNFNLNSDNNVDELDYLVFRVNAFNGFPLNALLQVYFADANYNIVDSLITDADSRIFAGAEVGPSPAYRVTSPSQKTTDIRINNPWLNRVQTSKFMIIKAGLETTNASLVKIYDDYSLDLKIGVKTGINIKSDN